MEEIYFDHDKLNVYKKALEFAAWVHRLLVKIKVKNSTTDQLDRASDSIVLNIAEGNGKFTSRDRCKYFDISKGSSLESAGCLDLLFVKELIDDLDRKNGKDQLKEIVSMIVGLIKSNSDRVYESEKSYSA
ncbi:MAG: four helix bundle protein [bacterium]